MLYLVRDLLDLGAGDPKLANELHRELAELADELNDALPEYEVRLTHLDTDDFLEFIPRQARPEREGNDESRDP